MTSDVPHHGQEEPGTPTEQERRRGPYRYIVTLKPEPTVRREGFTVESADSVTWRVEARPGTYVGLGLRMPANVPIRSFGPFDALEVNSAYLENGNCRIDITGSGTEGFPGDSLTFDFEVVILKDEAAILLETERMETVTEEEPPTDSELKIDKLSKPPTSVPEGRWKAWLRWEEGWHKILVEAARAPVVSPWSEPDPPAGDWNP